MSYVTPVTLQFHPRFTLLLYPTVPSQPTNLKVTRASATSVTVSWTPPSDTTGVTGYRICYTENGGREHSRDVSGANTKDTIPNLKIGSQYSITIVAISDGVKSEVVGPKTFELGKVTTIAL